MRFNAGKVCTVSLAAIFLMAGCDDAPPYTGPSLPASYKKYEKSPNPVVALETSAGKITLELFEDDTPITVTNFIELVEGKKYDGLTFHRIVKDFMVQGGDPSGNGRGGPGYKFNDEIDPKSNKNDQYCLSMANSGPNTNGSQFFIMTNPKGEHSLDGRHTVFGKVIEGKDVVDKLNLTELEPGTDKPKTPPKIVTATVLKKRGHPYKLEDSEKIMDNKALNLGPGSYSPEQIQKLMQQGKPGGK